MYKDLCFITTRSGRSVGMQAQMTAQHSSTSDQTSAGMTSHVTSDVKTRVIVEILTTEMPVVLLYVSPSIQGSMVAVTHTNPTPKVAISAHFCTFSNFSLLSIGIGIKKMIKSVAKCTVAVASHHAV
ncbi:hypothetical protein Ct61P_12888 [Colletotrichum tofieldiae]|nr:hypothetical protein Ct61P_12888 [Colletotrichum tofieldiae]